VAVAAVAGIAGVMPVPLELVAGAGAVVSGLLTKGSPKPT
jgi:hypothetical protein